MKNVNLKIKIMNLKESKVAIGPNCNKFVMASLLSKITEDQEKDFTELTNEGFEVKLETKEDTKSRIFSPYSVCSAKERTK